MYQLLSNPVRTASLLASLSSNSLDIDEALYLQEESAASHDSSREWSLDQVMDDAPEEVVDERSYSTDEELDNFDWESAMKPEETVKENPTEESMDDLLGDFLAQMNK